MSIINKELLDNCIKRYIKHLIIIRDLWYLHDTVYKL